MMHTLRSHRFAMASMLALVVGLGCGDSAKTPAVDESVAGRLIGTWDLTLSLDRPLSLSTDAHTLPRSVAGTVAFLEASKEHLSFEGLGAPTHMGVYHVDLGALGFPARDADVVPDLAARVVAAPRRDSVYILLNPETPRYALRFSGTFDANGASGVWVAESFLGGGGTFVMRRR
jgi:hypothetical protein